MPISQRYKQTGNAVTVNLIKKIAKIIKTVFIVVLLLRA